MTNYFMHLFQASHGKFHSKLVLASLETATDANYAAILGVIGHEYFLVYIVELQKHTDEAAAKVNVVLARTEEQGQMIESLHTSEMKSQCDEKKSDFIFCQKFLGEM
ncbi:uncharacterized protein LOC114257026 [Camellia sinensis]|uniref:uncharacterized protein LOC114257026 n=1 Tax=Camellia sinensis TaxID=4442 RepID=UPI0010359767|nr:uncharacterized protein LOC114257026 [Camellia sinensis]XP_028052542.1 uncharacterized protein LOC114257026 [Camellia sinensis]